VGQKTKIFTGTKKKTRLCPGKTKKGSLEPPGKKTTSENLQKNKKGPAEHEKKTFYGRPQIFGSSKKVRVVQKKGTEGVVRT